MKLSGFTIARNCVKFNYPFLESIRSILPICDEFVINVGDSEDNTLQLIQAMREPKIRIIQNKWDFSQGKEVLSFQTNLALKSCRGAWAFYLQGDEVIHEADLRRIKESLGRYENDAAVDALRFRWLHFYGSYYRYRIDSGWDQKQDRIIKNDGQVQSFGDAYGFRRKDGTPLRRKNTGCLLYHYGWVQPQELMTQRRVNAETIGFVSLNQNEREQNYSYGNLNRFPVYFGSHPSVMEERIKAHALSQQDLEEIKKKHRFHPLRILKVRHKTWKRVKERIG